MSITLASLLGSASAVAPDFMKDLKSSASVVGYDPESDVITFGLSVGDGRSATVIALPHDKIPTIVDVFREFDPEAVDTRVDRPIEDIIRSTLNVERESFEDSATGKALIAAMVAAGKDPKKNKIETPEGYVGPIVSYNFKVSDKPHTREVRVPVAKWHEFTDFIEGLSDQVSEELITAYVAVQEEENKRAQEKLARKLARENERSNPQTPAPLTNK